MNSVSKVIAVSAAALVLAAGTLVVAGPLSPAAGPVASSYKTLAEVEPRIAVNATNTPGDAICVFRITQPGSYYLTGNVSGQLDRQAVIVIAANNVTLDLNGFQILCNPSSQASSTQYGVSSNELALSGLTVKNGTILNAGTSSIAFSSTTGSRIDGIFAGYSGEGNIVAGKSANVTNCVVAYSGASGLAVLEGSTISNCTIKNAGTTGIGATRSTITHCTVVGAGETGIQVSTGSTVIGCSVAQAAVGYGAAWGAKFINCGAENCEGDGFLSGFNAVIDSCTASLNGGDGFELSDAAIIRNSATYNNVGHGINALGRSTILNNNCSGNGSNVAGTTSAGIYLAGADCRVEANNLLGNDWGIRANAGGNIIIRNTASGNTTVNYSTVAGNVWGPVVQGTTAASFSSNSSATSTGSTDPSANYSY